VDAVWLYSIAVIPISVTLLIFQIKQCSLVRDLFLFLPITKLGQ